MPLVLISTDLGLDGLAKFRLRQVRVCLSLYTKFKVDPTNQSGQTGQRNGRIMTSPKIPSTSRAIVGEHVRDDAQKLQDTFVPVARPSLSAQSFSALSWKGVH